MMFPFSEDDDPQFVLLVRAFVQCYARSFAAERLLLIHVDNWFGERWLGFAGKYKGLVGIRQRPGKLAIDGRKRSLAIPPFIPGRILNYAAFRFDLDGNCSEDSDCSPIHRYKNGGWIETLHPNGLYAWYSGSTNRNLTGCLMVYELNDGGENAWYIQFQKTNDRWAVTMCRNTQMRECKAIAASHYEQQRNETALAKSRVR